jgi:sialidase-1
MKTLKSLILGLSIFVMLFGCSKNTAGSTPPKISITSYAPQIPVLKGIDNNPFLRIDVTIGDKESSQNFKKIKYTLNASVVNDIEKIEAFLSPNSTFSNTNLIGTAKQVTENGEIPVDINLTEGLHFIWISIVLKNDASIQQKIEMHCLQLINQNNIEFGISQGNSVYQKYTGISVRKAGEDNINTYRIPGIITTDKGTLLSVYDIRYNNSGDLPGNIDVGLSRSVNGGKTWNPMKVIMDMGAPHENNGIGDPSILFDPITKKIFVAALWSKGNRSIAGSLPGLSPDTTGQFVIVSSEDDGITWTAPYTITPQVKNPIWNLFFNGPGNGIAMQDGKLVFAAQYWNESKIPYSTIIYSSDHGATWKGKILGPKSNTTESQVVETNPGTLMLNMRDNRGRYRSVATTSNMGDTWTEHATSYAALADPVCMGSFIKAKVNVKGVVKEVLFFSNPNTNAGRYNITIKASLDLGETWLPLNQLLIDERQSYGYSSLTKMDDNTIGILYEGIKDLYFVKVPVSEIIK